MNSTPRDYYVIRRPLFSVDRLKKLNFQIEQRNLESIKEIFSDPTFLTSIYLSSREFHHLAKHWLQSVTIFSPSDKIFLSLYKYYVRITSRATPYGLFGGFFTGKVSHQQTEIQFSANTAKLNMRMDMQFFEHMKTKILASKDCTEIPFRINNTLYKFDDASVRFIERDENFDYKIAEISSNEILEILVSFQHGLSKNKIIEHIRSHFGSLDYEEEIEVRQYIDDLIDNQVLIADIAPYLTNPIDPGIQFKNALQIYGISNLELDEIIQYAEKVNSQQSIDVSELELLFNKHDQRNQQLFQVDLAFDTLENNIKHKSLNRIIQQTMELANLSTVRSSPSIQKFKNDFIRKYELKRMPLLEVLDPEKGIGYGQQVSGNIEGMPLLEDVSFSYAYDPSIEIPKIISLIIQRYSHCFEKFTEISLSEEDVRGCSDDLSDSIIGDNYILGKIAADSFKDFDEGNFNFQLMNAVPTAFACKILSRFSCHDKELKIKNEQHAEVSEENKFAIAEIIHLPSLRQGNILLRPSFHEYEIPIYTFGNPSKTSIKLSDITVAVTSGSIRLWSESLNCEIKPRLSSAYNHPKAQLPLFKLLCDLQYEGLNEGFRWNWSILSDSKYLPRIRYKNIVLASARWRLKMGKRSSASALKEELDINNIPRHCEIREWDNVLLLDTDNEICLNIIKVQLEKNDVELHEAMDELYLIDQGEHVSFEVVLPFQVKGNLSSGSNEFRPNRFAVDKVQRVFAPGSEWFYIKFFCNHNTQNRVIQDIIYPLLRDREESGDYSTWFFIRYDDPLPHLRLRVKSSDMSGLMVQINKRADKMVNAGLIFSIQLDTYVRELERYGHNNIEASEALFCLDSVAVSKYIISSAKDGVQVDDKNWKAAILSVHQLLNDFHVSLDDRISLFNISYTNFRKEFVDLKRKEKVKEFKFSLDRKYRMYKDDLFKLLTEGREDLDENFGYFFNRSESAVELIPIIMDNFSGKVPLDIIASYVHMSINRLFYAKQRMNEMVIYYFLFKSYDSLKNR